jgi:TRAP-type C4-dicarboxylate transport system substrate-binding protein
MRRRISLVVFFLGLLFLFFPVILPAQQPVTLTLVEFRPDIPPGNLWVHMFMDKVKEKSKGRLIVKMIGGPEAIPAHDSAAACQKGAVDIASTMGMFADVLGRDILGCEMLGYTEYSSAELRKRGVWKVYQNRFAKVGLYFLGASTPSDPQVQVTFFFKKEIKRLDDFKGLKIASVGGSNKGLIEALGATCIPIPFTEYFTAMERGVVDGYNVGTPGIQDFGLVPVTKFMLDEPVAGCGSFFFVNLKKWESLPKELKDALTEAAAETEVDGAAAWADLLKKVKKEISEQGVKIGKLSPEESKKFYRTYRESMWADAYKKFPKQLVDETKQLITNPDFHRLK